jgi:hypothetical protein
MEGIRDGRLSRCAACGKAIGSCSLGRTRRGERPAGVRLRAWWNWQTRQI